MPTTNKPSAGQPTPRPARRGRRRAAILLGLLVALGAAAPWMLAKTPLRNLVLRVLLAESRLHVTTHDASLGWLSPLGVDGLQVVDVVGGSRFDVERVTAEKSWLELLWGAPDLGTLTIDRPRLDLVTRHLPQPDLPPPGRRSPREKPTFTAILRGVSVVVRGEPDQPPVVDIPNVDLTVRVRREEHGRVLTAEPTQLLNRQELTMDMCHRGLELVAPILANSANVGGLVSLRLDKLRVPLDAGQFGTDGAGRASNSAGRASPDPAQSLDRRSPEDTAEVEGHLVLHHVSAGLRNPLLTEIAQVVTKLLRAKMPSQVRIADETDIHFFVRDGRVFHEGMAFGLPEVSPDLQIRTSGSVGMDRSLDMLVDIPLPLNLIRDSPLMRKLSEHSLRLQVRGTLDKPELMLPDDRRWFNELTERLISPELAASAWGQLGANLSEPIAGSLLETVGSLMERRRKASAETGPGERSDKRVTTAAVPRIDRLRSLRENRRKGNEPRPEPFSEDAAPAKSPGGQPGAKGVEL